MSLGTVFTLVLITPVVGSFLYFFLLPLLIEIWPRNPRNAVAKNVREEEVDAQRMGVKGTVLLGQKGTVFAYDVATGNIKEVYQASPGMFVQSLAGPNKNGFVLISLKGWGDESKLRVVALDLRTGKTTEIANRQDKSWNLPQFIGIAIADEEDIACYFDPVDKLQLHDPQALYHRGNLHLRDLRTGSDVVAVEQCLDKEFALSPDATTIWYCAPRERDEVRDLPWMTSYPDGEGPVPVLLKFENGVSEPVLAGSRVRWMGTGEPLKVAVANQELLFDPVDGSNHARRWPDYVSDVRRILPSGAVIGMAKQARVEDVRFDKRPGSSGGPQPMLRIVAVNRDTQQVHTIAKHIDSTSVWCYGTYEIYKNALVHRDPSGSAHFAANGLG